MKDWWIVLRVQEDQNRKVWLHRRGSHGQSEKSKDGEKEAGEEGRCRGHGGAGGVFLKHNEPHSSKKINNALDLLFDLLFWKVFKGPFF